MIVRTPSPSVALRLLKVHVVLPTEAAFVFSCPVWSPLSLTQKVSQVVLTTSVSGAPFFAYRLPSNYLGSGAARQCGGCGRCSLSRRGSRWHDLPYQPQQNGGERPLTPPQGSRYSDKFSQRGLPLHVFPAALTRKPCIRREMTAQTPAISYQLSAISRQLSGV